MDEYSTGRRVSINFARESPPGRKVKDSKDRREVGYLGFYHSMLNLLDTMKKTDSEVYEELHDIMAGWIKETRYVSFVSSYRQLSNYTRQSLASSRFAGKKAKTNQVELKVFNRRKKN